MPKDMPMERNAFTGERMRGMRVRMAALALAAFSVLPARAQTGIDTAFARKLYSAGHDDLFHVGVGLKNTAYWLYNDSIKSDKPIACDKTKQDCSPAAFRLVEVIDTAKTDAFFKRHEIRAAKGAQGFLSQPPGYAHAYDLYISPTEVIFFMEDSLVGNLADLDAAKPVALNGTGSGKDRYQGRRGPAARPMGPWLLGRKAGPRP